MLSSCLLVAASPSFGTFHCDWWNISILLLLIFINVLYHFRFGISQLYERMGNFDGAADALLSLLSVVSPTNLDRFFAPPISTLLKLC